MKWILNILFFIPIIIFAQPTQNIEVCTSDNSYLQDYWVDDGPNQYFWNVEGGVIASGNGTNHITVNWLNVPYDQYLINVYVISDAGCLGNTVSLLVDIDECSFDGIYVPNSFTPNQDGKNDIFIPKGENIVELELFIFNRWGQQIYQSYSNQGWNGKYEGVGEMCQIDVYVWVINYRFDGENFMHDAIGHVVLIR